MNGCTKKVDNASVASRKHFLTCLNVSIERGGYKLFEDMSFTLLEGAGLVVKGANGSGKTSLLKVLAGLVKPSYGSVALASGYTSSDMLYIGHKNAIKGDATVLENLQFWAKLRGEPLLLAAAISHFGLGYYTDTPCRELSAGWQRRVALAKLICCPSKLWLLDEPTANLDAEGEAITLSLIKARIHSGGGVVAAMHKMNDAFNEVLPHAIYVQDFSGMHHDL
jgi:heme exporter protein A